MLKQYEKFLIQQNEVYTHRKKNGISKRSKGINIIRVEY